MKTVFADAFYYFALVNPGDARHARAREFTAGFTGRIVTTAWILTDCISFIVMEKEGIGEALTADHHYEQAGFIALLK